MGDAQDRFPKELGQAGTGSPDQNIGNTRRLGSLRGEIQIVDRDWWKPMSDEEVGHLFDPCD